jgi:hypothetical protein
LPLFFPLSSSAWSSSSVVIERTMFYTICVNIELKK